jgi:hypothetical protein
MGFSISWYAVPEQNADQFVQKLSLTPTGKTEEIPESLDAMGKLDTGWRVFWHNKYDCPFLKDSDLARLSLDQDILFCQVEEHVMASSAETWSHGKRQWRISHEGENGPKGIDVDGLLPDCYPKIRVGMEQKQAAEGGDEADVDYIFDIPLTVAKSMVRFKHDEICPHLIGKRFEVMTRNARTPGLLSRLFRRG